MSGLSPSDSFDEALADMIHDGVNDLRNDLAKGHFEKDETKKVRFFSLNSIGGGRGGGTPYHSLTGFPQGGKVGILPFEVIKG